MAGVTHGITLSKGSLVYAFGLGGVGTLNPGWGFEFPVNPSSIKIQRERDAYSVDILNFREVIRPGNRKLKRIEFASFLPAVYDPSYCHYSPIPGPWTIVSQVEQWMAAGEPVYLSITGTPVGLWVIITGFSTEERAGEPGDVYYTFTATEWVDVHVDVAEAKPWPLVTRPDPGAGGTTHTVVSGDTLWKIAKHFYGSGARWREIYDANKGVIGSNPNLIRPGQVLVIP